jgi:hypothetical protein
VNRATYAIGGGGGAAATAADAYPPGTYPA